MSPYSTIFFDLDDTLYPRTSGVWQGISERIDRYLVERLRFPPDQARRLRASYLTQYGTTLQGLTLHHDVDPEDYLDFVHDLPVERLLRPDPVLRSMLAMLSQQRLIFTNASRRHAVRVLRSLGVEAMIDGIIDIRATGFVNKPRPEAYRRALAAAGDPHPQACILVDDREENLLPAAAMGMTTVLVGGPPPGINPHIAISALTELTQAFPELQKSIPEATDGV